MLRTQYDKLFALIGTKFGAADEAHFNLPNLHHRFIEGTTTLSEVGSYVDAGLPNIWGQIADNYVGYGGPVNHGAFTFHAKGVDGRGMEPNSGNGSYCDFDFTASNYNPIYGASETNQPKSMRVTCLIRSY